MTSLTEEQKQHWREVVDKVRNDAFDMTRFACETGMCVGGHSVYLLMNQGKLKPSSYIKSECISINAYANSSEHKRLVGLSDEQASDLFYGEGVDLDDITRQGAIATLERFIETGEIKWVAEEQV